MPPVLSLMRAYRITFSPWRLGFSIPLATLEMLANSHGGKVRLQIASAAPGLRLSGTAHVVGALLDFGVRLDLDGMAYTTDQRTFAGHLSGLQLAVSDASVGPLAKVIRKGGIDITRPADLIGNQLGLPAAIVEARGERVVVDLLRLPRFAAGRPRRLLAIGSTFVGVTRITCTDDALEVKLGLFPAGLGGCLKALLRHGLMPWLERVTRTPHGACK